MNDGITLPLSSDLVVKAKDGIHIFYKDVTKMENKNITYITKYQKENTIQINVRLSKKYDQDIIAWLEMLGDLGKATYIKQLIRDDMENGIFKKGIV